MSLVRTPYYVASLLVEWVYIDSGIVLDRLELEKRLVEDCYCLEDESYEHELPTDKECEEFICGGDDGAQPPELLARFPATNAYLVEFWGSL